MCNTRAPLLLLLLAPALSAQDSALAKLQRRADIERQFIDADHIAGRHPVLFPACLNDCVHETSLRPGTPEASRPMV